MDEFEASLPLLWPPTVRELLASESLFPPAISGIWPPKLGMGAFETSDMPHLQRQERKLQADWSIVKKLFPVADFRDYAYYWCVVNTRSFYWEFPDEELPKDHNDRIVLVPFADYFNHCDDSVRNATIFLFQEVC